MSFELIYPDSDLFKALAQQIVTDWQNIGVEVVDVVQDVVVLEESELEPGIAPGATGVAPRRVIWVLAAAILGVATLGVSAAIGGENSILCSAASSRVVDGAA